MRDALDNLSIDGLPLSLGTVVGVLGHQRKPFAALNTQVDPLFALALKAPRHGTSDGPTPPSLLQAVKLRHLSNALFLSPDGQNPSRPSLPPPEERDNQHPPAQSYCFRKALAAQPWRRAEYDRGLPTAQSFQHTATLRRHHKRRPIFHGRETDPCGRGYVRSPLVETLRRGPPIPRHHGRRTRTLSRGLR